MRRIGQTKALPWAIPALVFALARGWHHDWLEAAPFLAASILVVFGMNIVTSRARDLRRPKQNSDAVTMVDEEHIVALDSALQLILQTELAKGNEVVETWRGWPEPESVGVALGRPFRVDHVLPTGVVFRNVDDPHWWKAEYAHEPSCHLLICRF